jgi:hypothetical protein
MNTVFAIQFTNHLYEDDGDYNIKDDKILDNKLYLNAHDAILALQSILDRLSTDEERLVEEGMHVYSVSSYELV